MNTSRTLKHNIKGDNMKKIKLIAGGFFVGIVNALFGAGGGMIAVPLLTKSGLSQKEAQATAVCVILPLTIITCFFYYFQGNLHFMKAVPFILPGLGGAVLGSVLLKKIPDTALKKIFALFMLWAGVRLIIK